jgi:hypothetical protein
LTDAAEYTRRIKEALEKINTKFYLSESEDGLRMYSPKFKAILENIKNEDNEGLIFYTVSSGTSRASR